MAAQPSFEEMQRYKQFCRQHEMQHPGSAIPSYTDYLEYLQFIQQSVNAHHLGDTQSTIPSAPQHGQGSHMPNLNPSINPQALQNTANSDSGLVAEVAELRKEIERLREKEGQADQGGAESDSSGDSDQGRGRTRRRKRSSSADFVLSRKKRALSTKEAKTRKELKVSRVFDRIYAGHLPPRTGQGQ